MDGLLAVDVARGNVVVVAIVVVSIVDADFALALGRVGGGVGSVGGNCAPGSPPFFTMARKRLVPSSMALLVLLLLLLLLLLGQ